GPALVHSASCNAVVCAVVEPGRLSRCNGVHCGPYGLDGDELQSWKVVTSASLASDSSVAAGAGRYCCNTDSSVCAPILLYLAWVNSEGRKTDAALPTIASAALRDSRAHGRIHPH